MAEQLDLSAPETKPAINTTFYRVVFIQLDWRLRTIMIHLQGENSEIKAFGYEGDEAQTLMVALNKANLSLISLHRRIINKLVADGKLSGTPSGTPD